MFHFGQTGPWLTLCVLLLCGPTVGVQAAPSLAEMVAAAAARNPGLELAGAERGVAEALRRKAEQPFADAPRANDQNLAHEILRDLDLRNCRLLPAL